MSQPSSGRLQVFISWSLPLAHDVALTLRDWLPRLIQSVDPWVSSEDIEKGTWWSQEIVEALESSTVGIVVITPENIDRAWINFEAGALARAIRPAGGIVAPLLINVAGSSIEGPLGNLQITRMDKRNFFQLVEAINSRIAEPLKDNVLSEEFELKWPVLEKRVKLAIEEAQRKEPAESPQLPRRRQEDILEDLVSATRELRQELRSSGRTATVQRRLPKPAPGPTDLQVLKIVEEEGLVVYDWEMVEGRPNFGPDIYHISVDKLPDEATKERISKRVAAVTNDAVEFRLLSPRVQFS
jgi:hypothetical protein